MILNHLDLFLGGNQNGFWKDSATTPQILNPRRVIVELKIYKQNASKLLVDFSKDFDIIHKKIMLYILLH